MKNTKDLQAESKADMPYSPFTAVVLPPLLLMGSSSLLWGMDDSTPLVDVGRYGSIAVSLFYLVVQVGFILVRGRPMYVDKKIS